jgi:O-antigen/teichoic acid export membrane protein
LTWTASGIARSRGAQVARNAFSGVGARLSTMGVGFVLTPYVVHHLGLRTFGLWSLIGSLAGYLGLLDFGLAGVFVKFIAEYVESDRRDLARQVVTFGALFYAAFGLLLAAPVVLLAPRVVRTFALPAGEIHTAVIVFEALVLLLVLSLIAGLPGSVVTGMQRMEVASRNGVVAYLVSAAVTVALLHAGWGIAGVVIAGYAQMIVAAVLQYRAARRIFGPIWHHPLRLDGTVVRRMFGFGGWTQLNQVLTIVGLDVGRFIAAATVGVVSVTFYELGSRLAFLSRSFPTYFLDAMMPAAAAADARDEAGALERMYVAGTLYTMFATCGIAGFLVGAGSLLVRVWMGTAYPAVSIVLAGLCAGYVFGGVTGVGMTVLRATGRPKYEAYCAGVTAAVNLGATAALAPFFGLAGVVAGTALGWLAGAIFFTVVYHRLHPAPWWRPIGRPALALVACGAASAAAAWAIVHAPQLAPLLAGRIAGGVALAIVGVVYSALYVALTLLSGAWRSDPASLLPRLMQRGRTLAGAAWAR